MQKNRAFIIWLRLFGHLLWILLSIPTVDAHMVPREKSSTDTAFNSLNRPDFIVWLRERMIAPSLNLLRKLDAQHLFYALTDEEIAKKIFERFELWGAFPWRVLNQFPVDQIAELPLSAVQIFSKLDSMTIEGLDHEVCFAILMKMEANHLKWTTMQLRGVTAYHINFLSLKEIQAVPLYVFIHLSGMTIMHLQPNHLIFIMAHPEAAHIDWLHSRVKNVLDDVDLPFMFSLPSKEAKHFLLLEAVPSISVDRWNSLSEEEFRKIPGVYLRFLADTNDEIIDNLKDSHQAIIEDAFDFKPLVKKKKLRIKTKLPRDIGRA